MVAELKPHILVVDDDDRLRDLIRRYLADQGFIVTTASHAADAEAKLASLQFDLMVLDIMMPGETGLELAARLKAQPKGSALPILLLTAMGEPEDRITGLETGADDYLTKPFEPRELVLRIRAILRRRPSAESSKPQPELRFGNYRYETAKGRLWQGEDVVYLTTQEQEILAILAASAGKPVSRDALVQAGGSGLNERSVDVQINRLRKKIEADSGKPQYIITVRGAGYVLQVDG